MGIPSQIHDKGVERMELKPCPFCGTPGELRTNEKNNKNFKPYTATIHCPSCAGVARAGIGDTEEEAVLMVTENWNARHKPNDLFRKDITDWAFHVYIPNTDITIGEFRKALDIVATCAKEIQIKDAENHDFSVSHIGWHEWSPYIEFNNHDYPTKKRIDLKEMLDGRIKDE
jgi:hypothetical protein